MRNEVKTVLEKLRGIEIKVKAYFDNTENEESQERLENELTSIQEAIEALEGIE
jgi:hypothetical protein